MVAGPSNVGKTFWVRRLLEDKHVFEHSPAGIMYCYSIYQPLFDEMEKSIDNITFHQGVPTESELKEFAGDDDRFKLVVLDDLMHECVKIWPFKCYL